VNLIQGVPPSQPSSSLSSSAVIIIIDGDGGSHGTGVCSVYDRWFIHRAGYFKHHQYWVGNRAPLQSIISIAWLSDSAELTFFSQDSI